MTYLIEPEIPIPLAKTAEGGFMSVLREMKTGDSFLIQDKTKYGKAKAAVSNYKKREGKGKNFTSRKVSIGLRIWGVK